MRAFFMHLTEEPLFNICFFIGLLFVVSGFVLYKFPPKKINSLYGYRTSGSMKSQERWDFSQIYSAKLLMRYGDILMICSALSFVSLFSARLKVIIGLVLVMGLVIVLVLKVEKKLHEEFDKG